MAEAQGSDDGKESFELATTLSPQCHTLRYHQEKKHVYICMHMTHRQMDAVKRTENIY